MDTLGKRIKHRREALGLGQTEVAKVVGVSQPTLAQLEGGRNGRSGYLWEFSIALKTTAEWLATGKGEPGGGEVQLLDWYRQLPDKDKQRLMNFADGLVQSNEPESPQKPVSPSGDDQNEEGGRRVV